HRGGSCRHQRLAAQSDALRGCRSPGHGPCRGLAPAPFDRGVAGHQALPLGRGCARAVRRLRVVLSLRTLPPAAKAGTAFRRGRCRLPWPRLPFLTLPVRTDPAGQGWGFALHTSAANSSEALSPKSSVSTRAKSAESAIVLSQRSDVEP